jgi:hypothetical protein
VWHEYGTHRREVDEMTNEPNQPHPADEIASDWEAGMTEAVEAIRDLAPTEWDALLKLSEDARNVLVVLGRLSSAQRDVLRTLIMLHPDDDRRPLALGMVANLAKLGLIDGLTNEEARELLGIPR